VIGGILADYIGRRRTMIFAILAYSLTTGLSAFAWDWVSFALLRFLVGIAIGSEWSTGASYRGGPAEPRARPRRGPDAMRARHRLLPRLVRLAVRERLWPGRLAHHVRHRHRAGAVCAMAAHRRREIKALGTSNEGDHRVPATGRKKSSLPGRAPFETFFLGLAQLVPGGAEAGCRQCATRTSTRATLSSGYSA
jgi:Major Facilitator Superfamily